MPASSKKEPFIAETGYLDLVTHLDGFDSLVAGPYTCFLVAICCSYFRESQGGYQ